MRLKGRKRITLLEAVILSLAVGCGDSSGRQKVAGAITFKGQPVDQGSIEFCPAPGGASHAGAVIENGNYTILAAKGLLPGTYAVKIYWPEEHRDKFGQIYYTDRIPLKYNVKTTLTGEVNKGANTIDFHLD